MKRLAALLVVLAISAGCSEEAPTYTNPSAPIVWGLPTQTDPGPADCPQIELTPIRIAWDATHRDLVLGGEKVLLPYGFSARLLQTGHLEILAPDGTVVARDNDMLTLGGSDYQHVCRVQGRTY